MYIDYQARLSDLQSFVSVAPSAITSTYILDTIQSGWAANDEVYARFQIGTALAGSAASSLTLAIQIAQDTAFSSLVTVVSVTKASTSLTANSIPLVVKLPVAMMTGQLAGSSSLYTADNAIKVPYRYVRALYTLTFGLSAGTVSCMLVGNTPTTIDRPL